MVLFPPWKYTFYLPGRIRIEKPGPYSFVFSPPEVPFDYGGYKEGLYQGRSRSAWSVNIDWLRLFLPVIAVGLITFTLTYIFRARGSLKE